jgi:ion channel-forming bestrophin family protein
MVKYNPKQWFSLIFHNYSKQVMKTLTPALVMMTIYSAACCYIMLDYFQLQEADFAPTIAMHSLMGIVLGLFLVFRTNTAYDRWWEGRKLWGAMVNSTRNLALKLHAYLDKDDRENRLWYSKMIPNFIYATKDSLRNNVIFESLDVPDETFIEELRKYKHIPNRISALMYERTNMLYQKGTLTGYHFLNLDKEQKDFIDFMGSCERIRSTPIPYSYMMYVKKFIVIYIVTLPFGFVTASGYFTIPIVLIITFILMSVELIAEEIEDPFGRDLNDLPTDELAEKIRANVREILL